MIRTINIHKTKAHLSKLVEEANKGKEVIIAKAGKPMARLVPLHGDRKRRKLGPLARKFSIPLDFDAPLPEEVVASFKSRRGHTTAR